MQVHSTWTATEVHIKYTRWNTY